MGSRKEVTTVGMWAPAVVVLGLLGALGGPVVEGEERAGEGRSSEATECPCRDVEVFRADRFRIAPHSLSKGEDNTRVTVVVIVENLTDDPLRLAFADSSRETSIAGDRGSVSSDCVITGMSSFWDLDEPEAQEPKSYSVLGAMGRTAVTLRFDFEESVLDSEFTLSTNVFVLDDGEPEAFAAGITGMTLGD